MPFPGAIDNVRAALQKHPSIDLVYLNYSYTREDDAKAVRCFPEFFASAIPISTPTPDKVEDIAIISTMSENFFTAIYCLVYRRDHATMAYSQNTAGRPFSTMLTCIPTTHYVLNRMMHRQGVWLGHPQVVVNMNVSWLKYAPLWILERIPEAFDLAEKMGADGKQIDVFRRNQLPGIRHWLAELIKGDPERNIDYINLKRFTSRFKHLPEFRNQIPEIERAFKSLCRC